MEYPDEEQCHLVGQRRKFFQDCEVGPSGHDLRYTGSAPATVLQNHTAQLLQEKEPHDLQLSGQGCHQ